MASENNVCIGLIMAFAALSAALTVYKTSENLEELTRPAVRTSEVRAYIHTLGE